MKNLPTILIVALGAAVLLAMCSGGGAGDSLALGGSLGELAAPATPDGGQPPAPTPGPGHAEAVGDCAAIVAEAVRLDPDSPLSGPGDVLWDEHMAACHPEDQPEPEPEPEPTPEPSIEADGQHRAPYTGHNGTAQRDAEPDPSVA